MRRDPGRWLIRGLLAALLTASLVTGGPFTRHGSDAVHLAGRVSSASIGESHDVPHAGHIAPVQPTHAKVAGIVSVAGELPIGYDAAAIAITLPATTGPAASPCRGPPSPLLRSLSTV